MVGGLRVERQTREGKKETGARSLSPSSSLAYLEEGFPGVCRDDQGDEA